MEPFVKWRLVRREVPNVPFIERGTIMDSDPTIPHPDPPTPPPQPDPPGTPVPGSPTPGKPPEPMHDPVPNPPPMHDPPPQPERDPPPAPSEPIDPPLHDLCLIRPLNQNAAAPPMDL